MNDEIKQKIYKEPEAQWGSIDQRMMMVDELRDRMAYHGIYGGVFTVNEVIKNERRI